MCASLLKRLPFSLLRHLPVSSASQPALGNHFVRYISQEPKLVTGTDSPVRKALRGKGKARSDITAFSSIPDISLVQQRFPELNIHPSVHVTDATSNLLRPQKLLPRDLARSLLQRDVLPGILFAKRFVNFYTEKERHIYVYELLRAFGRFNKGKLAIASGEVLEAAEDAQTEEVDDPGIEVEDLRKQLRNLLEKTANLQLAVEDKLSGLFSGHVEFILYRLDKILDVGRYKAQVVIEVKKLLESKEYLAQVLGELAVAGFQNKSETWGCLTDVLRWRFFQFLELPDGTFEVRGSRIYHLFDSSYNTTPDTLECLSMMYYAIFPEMAVPQVAEFEDALSALDEDLAQESAAVARNFEANLQQAEVLARLVAEKEAAVVARDKEKEAAVVALAEKDKIIAALQARHKLEK